MDSKIGLFQGLGEVPGLNVWSKNRIFHLLEFFLWSGAGTPVFS
jgi:hypothetical protein